MTDKQADEPIIVGPGTGGSPARSADPADVKDAEAAADPDVAELVEDLKSDEEGLDQRRRELEERVPEAAREVGTGTDS